jgi:hypothetical protein
MKCGLVAGWLGAFFDLHAEDRSAKLYLENPEFLPPTFEVRRAAESSYFSSILEKVQETVLSISFSLALSL